ncbi:serine protease 7-like, partial [Rhagoletis pomonella]|uniref:serine protease 7-like n=1 Tax=Rhagoletis pomonella TaxID=28610 RepID=UPI00177AB853
IEQICDQFKFYHRPFCEPVNPQNPQTTNIYLPSSSVTDVKPENSLFTIRTICSSTIHLGEYDIAKEIDCIQQDCNNKVVKLGYEQVIPHPQYQPNNNNRHHDIALIRLAEDVTYSDFIRPVCLPLASTRQAINVGELLTVAGWGRTLLARQSNVKQELAVPVVEHDACARKFSSRNVNLITSQLCAGGEFSKDSCDGDSGGPLMRQSTNNRWYLEGVVSFGNRCGLEGWPAVYTRVADYVDWIEQSLRP